MTMVILAQGRDRRQFIRDSFKRLAGRIPSGPILVKPKVDPVEGYPASTHPEVLDEILTLLSGRDVTVADGWDDPPFRTPAPGAAHPLARVCQKHGLELKNLHLLPSVGHRAGSEEIRLADAVLSAACIVSLPVFHCIPAGKLSGALNNWHGLLAPEQPGRLVSGRGQSHRVLALLARMLPPALVFADATEVLLQPNAFVQDRQALTVGVMLAGESPAAIDSFMLRRLRDALPGFRIGDETSFPPLRAARDQGILPRAYQLEWLGEPPPKPLPHRPASPTAGWRLSL